MRKFRAWYKNSQTWVYFAIGEMWTDLGKEIYSHLCIEGATFYFYTGLKDKNGKEIYEGDVVIASRDDYTHKGNVVIKWNDEAAGFMLGYIDNLMSIYYEYEIIGNIHENPELLT